MSPRPLVLPAPAKINLILEIVGHRPDGYHELKTVMHTLELADILKFIPRRQGLEVTCDHPDVPSGEGNLVYRAAKLLGEAAGVDPHFHIHIQKRIPVAAGMGGGSSDAAATLRGLSFLWNWNKPSALLAIAKQLGSDVPFFLKGGCALGKGRGDRLFSWPSAAGLGVVLVNPGIPVSTMQMYKKFSLRLTRKKTYINMMRQALREKNVVKISKYLFNHLETVAEKLYPVVGEIKEALLRGGAIAAMMTGSGPTVFGLMPSLETARNLQLQLPARYPWVVTTRTSQAWTKSFS